MKAGGRQLPVDNTPASGLHGFPVLKPHAVDRVQQPVWDGAFARLKAQGVPLHIAYFHYLVIPENPAGGCELYWLEKLAERHHVTVFSLEFRPRGQPQIEWVRVPAIRRPLFLLFLLYHIMAPLAYGWYRFRRRVSFDLIHTIESNLTLGDVVSAHFCHTAFLQEHWRWKGNLHLRGLCRWLDHKLHAMLEERVFRRARLIVVPSRGLARELCQYWPALGAKIRVIPYPIDLEHYQPPESFDRQGERARLGFRNQDVVLCFVALGHFERKGLPALLIALERLAHLPVRLLVVGGHPSTLKPYRNVVAARDLCPKVVFAGQVNDPRPYYWCSDGFILPSVYETFSKVCFEAAACGLPILVNRLHGVEELLEDGRNGFLVRPDPESVMKGIERFVALSPAERQMMGARAREGVRRYSIAAYLERWSEVLDELLAGRSLRNRKDAAEAGMPASAETAGTREVKQC